MYVIYYRKKLIGLDALLEDYQKDQKKLNEKKNKQKKVRKICDAEDEDDDAEVARLSECVDKCEKQAWFSSYFCFELLLFSFFAE